MFVCSDVCIIGMLFLLRNLLFINGFFFFFFFYTYWFFIKDVLKGTDEQPDKEMHRAKKLVLNVQRTAINAGRIQR